MAEKKKKKYIHKLRNKFRLVILNDDTFEEKLSIKLSRMNVFVLFGSTSIVLVLITIFIIAFTPLREYIPGYSSTEVRKQAILLDQKADSLEYQLHLYDQYLDHIQRIVLGEPISDSLALQPSDTGIKKPQESDLAPSTEENKLRDFVEEEDQYNLPEYKSSLSNFSFFTPLKGVVTSEYEPLKDHFAVDIAAAKNSPIKSCLDGTVLMASWTNETGYVMIIQHSNELISVYKHTSSLLKKQGDIVRTGEAIAIMGNSGEQSTGPHLHFELWYKGIPVNPEDYIAF